MLELEHELRARLAGVRLVMEAGLDDVTFERVESAVRRLSNAVHGQVWLTHKLPAVLLVHLVGCGSRLESGSFWPTASLGGRFDQLTLGPAFERAIHELRLETFPMLVDEKAHRFVAPILAHGGIPRYAADRYIDILVATLTRHGMSTAAELASFWRSRRTALEFGQRPIRRFLLYGGAPALDYLDRTIDLARRPADEARLTGTTELRLPDHIVEAYVRYMERRGGDRVGGRAGPSLPRPRVVLDPFDASGPYLELPVLPAALGRGTWTVDSGAAVTTYRTSSFDVQRLPLHPSLSWGAELRLDDGAVRTSAFEALGQSPYVLFEPQGGSFVDDLRPVGVEECWLLAPREASVTAEDATGRSVDVRVVTTLPDPGGSWAGYSIRHLDLVGLATVKVSVASVTGGLVEGLVHVVASSSRPRLVDEPVPGITTGDGAPVFALVPRLFVPRLAGYDDDRWLITVSDHRGRRTEPLDRLGGSGVEVQLAPLAHADAFGEIDLTVRGPLGSDLRRRFAIVRDIEADVPGTVLLPGDEAGRSIAVRSHDSIELGSSVTPGSGGVVRVPIPSSGDRTSVRASHGGHTLELVVRYPRLLWAIRRPGSVPQLSAKSDRIDADELIDGMVESLLVSTLLEGRLIRTALENGAQVIHELPSGRTAPPEGRWAVPLGALRDTVRLAEAPHLTLAIEVEDRRVRVADVVATARAVEIHAGLVDGQDGRHVRVSFTEARRLADVVVRLWSCERPWEPAIVATAQGDEEPHADFPPGVVQVGRYRVEVAVHDPWFEPARPASGSVSCADVEIGTPDELLGADLALEHPSDPRDLVSLAIVTGVPPAEFLPHHVASVWTELVASVRSLMADLARDPKAGRSLGALVQLMAREPRLLYDQLASNDDHGGFDAGELIRLFLMARPSLPEGELPQMPDRVLRPLWRSCPPFAALADIPAARSGDVEAVARCEEHLGWRPDAAPPPVGRGPGIAELSLTPSGLATLRDVLALVPTTLLSWDTYQAGCFDWLASCCADKALAAAWQARASGALDGTSFGPVLDAYVEARRGVKHPDYGWADGLRASLACAIHVAANDGLAGFAGDMLGELLSFSRQLVAHDLVLSIALLTPDQADGLRQLTSIQDEERAAGDDRWQAVLAAVESREHMTAYVDAVDSDGAVLARIDGFKGRVKPHERGWTVAERAARILPGDALEVVIVATDLAQHRVDLSVRRARPSPWLDPGRRPVVGDVLTVTVTAAKSFGVFASTDTGVEGLVHVSHLPDDDLPDAGDEREALLAQRYPVGSSLRVMVLDIDAMVERMTLSAVDA